MASPSSAVAVASSRQRIPSLDLRAGDERGALQREAQHLEVGNAVPAPELGGVRAELLRRGPVAAGVGEVALLEGEPAVRGPGLEGIEEAMCAPEPAARHGAGGAEVELVGGEPDGHPRGARRRRPARRYRR